MKKNLLVLLILASAFGMGCSLVTARVHTGPKIEIKEKQYDFGQVVQGQQVVHAFEVRNIGDEVLEIEKVQTS
jgi:hypothetical protein